MLKGLPVVVAGTVLLAQIPTDPPDAGQITIGVLIAIYVVKELIQALVPLFKKNGSGAKSSISADQIAKLTDMVRDLHRWHDVRDADGTPVWWTQRQVLRELVQILADQRDILAELQRVARDTRDDVAELRRDQARQSKPD